MLVLLFWGERSNFCVHLPGSKTPSLGGSRQGLAEHDPIPIAQPQGTPGFPSATSDAQQPAVPSQASPKDQYFPPTHNP